MKRYFLNDLGNLLAQVRSRRSRMVEQESHAAPKRAYTPQWGDPRADYGGGIARNRLQGASRKLHQNVQSYKQIKDKNDK